MENTFVPSSGGGIPFGMKHVQEGSGTMVVFSKDPPSGSSRIFSSAFSKESIATAVRVYPVLLTTIESTAIEAALLIGSLLSSVRLDNWLYTAEFICDCDRNRAEYVFSDVFIMQT